MEAKELWNSLNIIRHYISGIYMAGSDAEIQTYSHIYDEVYKDREIAQQIMCYV
jgi:hypothetical protein